MLNWEYDADAERRVLRKEALEEGLQQGRQEGRQEGKQEGAELLAKLIKDGIPLDEALERVKNTQIVH